MKKIFTLFLLILMGLQLNVFAEDINIPGLEIPKLIITEVRPDGASTTYVELTNIGDTAINLDPFTLHSVHYNTRCTDYSDSAISFNRLNAAVDATIGKIYLKGVLQPGESFVVANVWDADNERGSGIPNHNIAIAQIGKQFAHINEEFNDNGWINKPEWQTFGKDSVSARPNVHIRAEETAGYLLHWVFETDSATFDSTYIDQFNHFWYPDENTANGINISMKGFNVYPIAGVVDAMTTSVMVRKASVTQGNLDWNQSRGTDALTSEWLVIPKNTSKDLAFTTVDNHDVYALDYTVKDPATIIVNEGANTISVPWEMVRGDSLSRYFNLGDGMSWSYDLVGVFEDSASYIARPGDKFSFYAVGNEVQQADYTLEVREPEADVAMVFPRRQIVEEILITDDGSGAVGAIDTIITIGWSPGFVYGLSEGPEIDSIINVPFATRTDSLLKYLDKPEKAEWEFVFVDGNDRVDLKFGDKLKVTSEDGSTIKEYFVAVDDHVLSDNALLETVVWPDIDPNQYPRWIVSDTLPEFTSLKTQYNVELRFDAMNIPAFQFIPQDIRASIDVVNATDIDGTMEQRTTVVTVTAESDTTTVTYYFTFIRQNTPVQPNIAEPFISEMVWNVQTQGCAVEIYNPGTEDLDLSRYMYLAGKTSQTWQEAVETLVSDGQYTSGDGIKIYQTHYVPSKRWAADGSLAAWSAIPDAENPFVGKGFLKDDNQTDPWVAGQDVWIMGVGTSGSRSTQIKIRQESDFIFRGSADDGTLFAWDSTKILHRETPIWNDPRHNMWLLKVLNDSILDGTMDVRDHTQYELIDKVEVIGDTIAGRLAKGKNWNLIRKPHITKGNLERMGGASSTPESSEWILRKGTDDGVGNDNMVANVGIHTIDPITNYLSTVTSVKLIVTVGFEGELLSITGDISNYTPTTIALVLDKGDDSQTFAFMRGDTELTADQSLADGDVLVVTSGDGKNVTNYTLIDSPLDSNTSLTAVAGSGLTVTGDKVTGVTLGMTLKEAVANLEVAEKSVLNVLDAAGALQPLTVHKLDSTIVDILISDRVSLQVIAENSDEAAYYFDFGFASNEAVLFSDILEIDQDSLEIMELPEGSTALSMLAMLYANQGATLKILDKAGFERETGIMNIDDVVEVTAPDGVTKVVYTFYIEGQEIIDPEPESVYTFGESSIAVIYPNPASSVIHIKGFEVSTVKVYSLSGVLMVSKSDYNQSVDVSSIPSGIYFIKMTDVEGKVAVGKFIKK